MTPGPATGGVIPAAIPSGVKALAEAEANLAQAVVRWSQRGQENLPLLDKTCWSARPGISSRDQRDNWMTEMSSDQHVVREPYAAFVDV